MRKNWIGAGLFGVGVVAAIVWVLVRPEPPKSAQKSESLPPTVEAKVETVDAVNAPRWLEVTGNVRPELEATISTKVMGRITSITVREGDTVRQGQPLIYLDARDLEAAITQANANLRVAGTGYENARVAADMERSMSRARISEAEARVEQSEAALKSAQARLDLVLTGPRKQERQQASLAVAQAQANLALAESNLKRYQNLVNEGAVSRQQFETAQTQYAVAKAQYESAVQSQSIAEEGSRAEEIRAAQEAVRQAEANLQQAQAGLRQARASAMQVTVRAQEVRGAQAQIGQAEAMLKIARVNRDYATINAPFDGIVTRRLADPGAMAGPGAPLLIVQGGAIRLEAVVPESALRAVRKGDTIPVTLDALAGQTLGGRVAEISPQGDPASHTFLVKIDLPRTANVKAGMFGRARIAVGFENRLMVPASAVWEREGLRYVYVVDRENVARLRMITVGEGEGENLPVLSGLSRGERVVAEGREKVRDGMKVHSR
jgi:RND family efflux transporter MFP subunit